jgi:hypothetical protein
MLYVSVVLFNTIINVFTPPNFDVFIPEIISVNSISSDLEPLLSMFITLGF